MATTTTETHTEADGAAHKAVFPPLDAKTFPSQIFWLLIFFGALYLLMHGQTMHALLLIAWGVVVVSGIDNIIRPLFISGIAKLHILLIMLGVLGGILAFGITGVVAGPVILALVLVFFEESRQETALPGGHNHS